MEKFWKEQGKESKEHKPRELHFEIRAIRALWQGQYTEAQKAVEAELTLGRKSSLPIWTSRIQGLVALGLGNLAKAEEHLYQALADARSMNHIREELPVLVGLAELKRQQGEFNTAREHLGDIWELAERNAFRIYQADAFNILAQISRDEGLLDEAVEAARRAYYLAWCDGPPFVYHWGLQIAKDHLTALNVPEPSLPPFDQKKHQPMPDEGVPPVDAPL
jgi:tetratricopeptide (TPR) repeat protein